MGRQKQNNSPILGVDLDAIMLASQPSFAADVLLLSRVLMKLRNTWSAKCGVPTKAFFTHIPLYVNEIAIWGVRRAALTSLLL